MSSRQTLTVHALVSVKFSTYFGDNHTTQGEKLSQLRNLSSDLQTPLLLPEVTLFPAFIGERFLILVPIVREVGAPGGGFWLSLE